MGKIIGRLTSVGIKQEASRGTPLAPSVWVPVQSFDYDDKPTYIDNDSGFGNIAEFNESDVNTIHAEGSYDGKVFDKVVDKELVAVFGQAPTITQRGTSGVYDKDYAMLNNNQHASLSLSYKDDINDTRYAMAMVEEFNLDAALDKYLTRSISFKSRKGADVTNTVAYTGYGNEFLAKHITVKMADETADLDASTAIKASAFSLSIKKNLKIDFVFGADTPDDIINQQLNVDGSFELTGTDADIRDKHLNGTAQALQFEAINTGVEIGTGSDNPAIRFRLPKVALKENPRSWNNNEVLTMSVNFQGNFSITEAALITARVTNDSATV